MVNKYNNKIYNYINYFTLACIVPLGYFAPIGEWLLLSFLSIKFTYKTGIPISINLKDFKIYAKEKDNTKIAAKIGELEERLIDLEGKV